jgi:hypothetical protein
VVGNETKVLVHDAAPDAGGRLSIYEEKTWAANRPVRGPFSPAESFATRFDYATSATDLPSCRIDLGLVGGLDSCSSVG